ncbi:MAG: PilZ domain [Pseudomonadota bacterium]|jgi:hypothetical protein
MEHRWGERRTLSLPVQLRVNGGRVLQGWLRDVSVSGCRVELAMACDGALHQPVEVLLPHRPGQLQRQALAGQVARHDGTTWGIEWNDLAPEALGFWSGQHAA